MSCPNASTTTLLWLYEGNSADEPAVLEHIARCDECQGVVAEHGDLMAMVGPVLPALARSEPARPQRSNAATWGGAALAIAAIAATWLLAVPSNADLHDTGLSPVESSAAVMATDFWADDSFENELDALDQELRDLSMDLLTL
jgi:hypothetical protein